MTVHLTGYVWCIYRTGRCLNLETMTAGYSLTSYMLLCGLSEYSVIVWQFVDCYICL